MMTPGNGAPDAIRTTARPSVRPMPEVRGYEVLERIGKGGMGEVYLARQLALGRLVAIKFLVPEGETDPEHELARFRREAELMAKVSHPNILSIYDFGEADSRPYLVMEYVEGGDLRRRLVTGHPMSADQVRSILMPVGEALAHLHRQGIIHRDLKPENILLHDGENPRVTDFGVAVLRAGAGAMTHTGWGVGTLGYVAPEQQYRLKVDEAADQYSLAALAYEMVTGQLPLGVFKAPSQLNSRLGSEVDTVILRALREDPKDRFPTIREFTAELDRALALHPLRSPHPGLRRAAWAISGVLVVAGVVAISLLRGRLPIEAPVPRPVPAAPALAKPAPAQRSAPKEERPPLIEQLKSLRAEKIWKDRGEPTGEAGRALQDQIWFEAAERIQKELKELAYSIWESRGRPTGPEGEAVRDEIWAEAERTLYKKMTGKEWSETKSR